MAKIFRKSDRIKVKIGEGDEGIVLFLAPLSQHQKVTIQSMLLKANSSRDASKANEGVAKAIKSSIKKMEGVKDSDGNEYQLKFENDELTEDCVDDIMNMSLSGKVMMVCTGMVNGVPTEFKDQDGNKVVDVEILGTESEKK